MILDTEFLIALDNQNRAAVDKAAELEGSGVPLRVPTMGLAELYVGAGPGARSSRNARKYEALVANKPVVGMDANIARQAGALEGAHITSDSEPDLGPGDAIVAATGLQYNEPVVTNDGDFERADGPDVELF